MRRLASMIRARRGLLAGVIVLALALPLLSAPLALADAFSPESGGSANADKIDTLYKITLFLGFLIFLLVEGVLVYSLVKYRYRRGMAEPAQIRGNTRLEIGWTVGAAVIVVVLAGITFAFLPAINNPPATGPQGLASEGVAFAAIDQKAPPGGKSLEIGVNGQQYLWRYDYPAGEEGPLFSYYEMVVPIDTTVLLQITSQDVNHSWWIPQLGGKFDAIAGHSNETWFKIEKPGVYQGQCAELCGTNHAEMIARVRAMPVAEYQAWATKQRADIRKSSEELAAERRRREEQAASAEAQPGGSETATPTPPAPTE